MADASQRAHLICTVGTNNYDEATYQLGEVFWRTRYTPVATARLAGAPPGRATILVTPEARAVHLPGITEELQAADWEPVPLGVPLGRDERELDAIFLSIVDAVAADDHVILDVTNSLRHLPFVYHAALTYLTAFKQVRIARITYGAFELRDPETGTVPILDLTRLFALTRWFHAVQSAAESGNLQPLATALREDVRDLFARGMGDRMLSRVGQRLLDLAPLVSAALPLEAGIAARGLRDALRDLDAQPDRTSIGRRSLEPVARQADAWATPPGVREKAKLALTQAELARQLAFIRGHAERGNVQPALLLLREWLVSLTLLLQGDPARWLDRDHREEVAALLGAFSQRARFRVSVGGEADLGSLWNKITDKRNPLAHGGMTTDPALPSIQNALELLQGCEALLDRLPFEIAPPGQETVLITPLGLSPGVLYSAVLRIRPERTIVVTSEEARAGAQAALSAAGLPDHELLTLTMREPFTGYEEVRSLAATIRPAILAAREVVLNLTGGTTAMQYVVEQLGGEARRLGVPVRRVFLVDRRPAEEQRAQPFILGEILELEPTSPSGEHA